MGADEQRHHRVAQVQGKAGEVEQCPQQEAFERVDRIADDRYPDRATDAATTRRYFTTWAHELLDDH